MPMVPWTSYRARLLALAAAAVVSAHALVYSGEVTLIINSADQEVDPDTLANAVDKANAAAAGGLSYLNVVEIGVGADQTAPSGSGGGPLYLVFGGPDPDDPTNLAGGGGMRSFKLTGTGGGYVVLGFDQDAENRNRVLEIINVSGLDSAVAVSGVHIANGALTAAGGAASVGGGGMHIGSAAGGGVKYATAGKHADSIAVSATKVSGNTVALTANAAGDMRAAFGGGAYIDATAYVDGNGNPVNKAGSTVVFSNVAFENNSVSVDSSANAGGTGSSSFGGGFRVKNAKKFTYTDGEISGNTAKTISGSLAAGGGMAIDDYTLAAELKNLRVSGNTALAENAGLAAGGVAKALGGGLYALHDGTDGDKLSLGVSAATFEKNQAKATGDNVDAYGGGAFLGGGAEAAFSGVEFLSNEAASEKGAAGGGGVGQASGLALSFADSVFSGNKASGKTEAWGGGVHSTGTLTVSHSTFAGNEASGDVARGGGIHALGAATLGNDSLVRENKATGAAEARGAGVYAAGTLDISSTLFEKNEASAADLARGGGLFAAGAATLDAVRFAANTAKGGAARGGGAYVGAGGDLTGIEFIGNNAAGGTSGQGGGLFTAGGVAVSGGLVSGNAAAGDSARGGGVYATGNLALEDTDVTDNLATGDADAHGGGVYMDTGFAGGGGLTLKAGADSVVAVSGNKANGVADGVHFGGSGLSNGVFTVDADALGEVRLLDPVTVRMTDAGSFAFNRAGDGLLRWGGANVFETVGGSTINLASGETYLTADFTAAAEGTGSFTVNLGGVFAFDGSRDKELALFTFSGGAGDVLTVDDDIVIKVDFSSELLGGTLTYLLADNYAGLPDGIAAGPHVWEDTESVVTVDGDGKVWLTSTGKTVYQHLIAGADPNTRAAIDSGAMSEAFRDLSSEQRALLTSGAYHFNNFTPGWYMNMALAGQETLISGAETARRHGLGKTAFPPSDGPDVGETVSEGGLASLDAASESGTRVWAGYLGDFDRVDSRGGLHGYKANRHGFIAGFNYDHARVGSIGLYAGYSRGRFKSRDVAAELESDTGHAGVIGKISPLREVPEFTLYADAGYTFSDNEGHRGAGALRTDSEFDQKYYTIGLEAEYSARLGGAFLGPFLSARYTSVQQEAFSERGPMAADVEDVDGHSLATRLGASAGFDVRTGMGVVTPSLSVAWRHDFGDRQFSSNASFRSAATPVSYRVRSLKLNRDSVDIGAAVRARLNDAGDRPMGVDIGYNLNSGGGRKAHSLYVGFDLGF